MKYTVIWARTDGHDHGEIDEPFDTREEADAEVERMKAEDAENGEAGMWVYVVEEKEDDEEEEDGESEGKELECGDYPDERSVVCADGRVRRFASGYQREMWEIGMRERDFY